MKTVVEYDVGHDVVNLLVQGNRGFEDTSRTGKNTWANPKSKKDGEDIEFDAIR